MLGKIIAWIALLGLRTTAQHYDNRKIAQMAGMPSVQNHFLVSEAGNTSSTT